MRHENAVASMLLTIGGQVQLMVMMGRLLPDAKRILTCVMLLRI